MYKPITLAAVMMTLFATPSPAHAASANSETMKRQLHDLLASNELGSEFFGYGTAENDRTVVFVTSLTGTARKTLAARFGGRVSFEKLSPPHFTDLDRNKDNTPHYGGAAYGKYNNAHTYTDGTKCSVAFPVERSGVRYMLTAGHCMPGGEGTYAYLWAPNTPGDDIAYNFGYIYTTVYGGTNGHPTEGTQDNYGDWALIQGSTYAPYVYNCPRNTAPCSYLKVGDVSWTAPTIPTAVCTSGFVTGQICRYSVFRTDITTRMYHSDGTSHLVSHIVQLRHDSNLDGQPDCDRVEEGDSGGAVYQGISGQPGYIRAMGIITGRDQSTDPAHCYTYYTELKGLKTFSSAFTMPMAPPAPPD